MPRVGWDAMATWRDLRMGDAGDLWHRAIIDPTVLRMVGRVQGRRILDLACGNGYLTRRWARAGAASSVGLDLSRKTIACARRRERAAPTGAEFVQGSATAMTKFADRSFDLVVANMALMDIEDAAGVVREVARVLAPEGRFIFSICHPCFDLDERSGWVVERVREANGYWHDVVWRKVRGYRTEVPSEVPWDMGTGETGWTTSYHRTLGTYSRYLHDAGLVIRRLEEPAPLPEAVRKSPQGPYMLEVPLHLVIEAVPDATRRQVPTRPGSRTRGRSPRRGGRRSGSDARRRDTGSSRRGSSPGS